MAPEQHDTLDGIKEPAENAFLVGHDDARAGLAAAYRNGKLPHALLFAGPAGIGKATLAFHLANYLLTNPDHRGAPETISDPDERSPVFRQVAQGAHPGALHLTRPFDAKTKKFKTVLTVEEVRRINRFLSLTAHDGGYRVVIVDTAEDLNTSAANALLKNLEEPPSRTLFTLIANSTGALLPTIRSRCQIVRFAPLSPDDLATALTKAGASPPPGAVEQAALHRRAGGSVRQAILLTTYGGLEIAETLEKAARSPRLTPSEAHRLADAVNGRERSVQFDILNDHALGMLNQAALAAAGSADLAGAFRYTQVWDELRVAITEAETYNLDRKQHALNMILRLNETFRM